MSDIHPYLQAFRGSFSGVLRWQQLEQLWSRILEDPQNGWYIYAVGEEPPTTLLSGQQLLTVIHELDMLLRRDHDEDYCGIVYTDDMVKPTFIKIFDPHNLGSTCGSSGTPPLPGWILSKIQPINLPKAMPQPTNRRHWWQKLLHHG